MALKGLFPLISFRFHTEIVWKMHVTAAEAVRDCGCRIPEQLKRHLLLKHSLILFAFL